MATASQSALSKLHSPLKELVAGAVQEGSPDFGRTEKDQTDVAGWIDIVAAGNSVKPDTLKASRQSSSPWVLEVRGVYDLAARHNALLCSSLLLLYGDSPPPACRP